MQYTLDRIQLTRLVDEVKELRDWTVVRDFCEQIYGPGQVKSATLETHGEYNDEGGTDYSVESVEVVDSNGVHLEYDLTLPFWQHILKDRESVYDDEQEDAEDALRDWYRISTDEEAVKQLWLAWDDLPVDVHGGGSEIYDFTETPRLGFNIQPI